ncbi:hypothetical protein LSAT2_006834 [Lamellibrachia satsuma]|nr:hypothetical protein LSAT2_006834 [Lamellibrachia satsuma]
MEKLAMRRQRKQEAREERENPVMPEDKTVKDNREMESKSADLVHSQTAVSASGDGANTSNGPKAIMAVLHHGPGGDGGEEADLFVGSKTTHKPKNKRKKGGFKTSKVTMSLGEFRGNTNEDDVSETDYGLMGLDDFDDCNYGYAPDVLNGYIDTPTTETTITKDTLFSIFADLLHNHGPLHITDPTLHEELQVFPEQVHHLIEGAGGLRQFLLQSPEFSIVEDVVSLANTDTTSQEPVGTYLKNNFEPPLSAGNVAHMERVLSNCSVSRLKQNYDTESVSSEGSFASLLSAPRTSTAQLAPIELDEKSMIHCDSKDNMIYIDQKTLRGNIENACGLSEYSPPCFLEESAPPMPWYSGGTNEYSDLDDNVPERLDDPKRPHDPERFDDPERVDDPEEELSPDEYEFLMRNRQFVPATNNTTTNGGCDTDLKQTVPSESVASLATFSDYERGPSLPRQQPPFHGDHNYNGQYPQPVNIIGHNHVTSTITDFPYTHQSPVSVVPSTMTDFPYAHQSPVPVVPSTMTDFPYTHQSPVSVVPSMMTDFPYAHQSPVPVVTAADKAYILELEEKQEELKVIIMQEQDKYMQFQHETDERINAMQMDSAKSLSISDERINSLCREYAQLKESSNAQIGSLFTAVENLKGEIQEHRRVAVEFQAVSASWQEKNTSLSNEIQALNSQLQNVKLKEDRLAADILEKDKKLVSLTKDLTRERDLRALKESEMSEVETKLATVLSRAQSSEVELLQLKLDVGMQILSRSENDATIYSNMFTKQAKDRISPGRMATSEEVTHEQTVEGKNPAVSSQFLEAGAEWYKTAARLRSMKSETERSFKDQIVKVEGGQPLSDLPKLPLPKPPHPPKTPVLPVMMKPETPMRQVTPPRTTEAQPSQMGAQAQVSAAAAPPGGATKPSAINKVHAVTPQSRPTQPSQHPVPQARGPQPQGPQPPRPQPVVRPPRPSSSLDKIMLSLHSVYPTFTKQQFKYYIDELRSQRHGSLTGLKLEDIVSSVAVIIQGNNVRLLSNVVFTFG